MDAVCGKDNWDVAVVFDKGEQLKGILIYYLRRKFGMTYITQPAQTPYTGLWLNYDIEINSYRKNRFEKKIIQKLIVQLPPYDWLDQRCHYQLTNWLPFYWKGYSQSTRYTYLIKGIKNIDKTFKTIRYNERWSIRKALAENISIINGPELFQQFYEIYSTSNQANGIVGTSFDQLNSIHKSIQANHAGSLFLAIDNDKNIHAGAYIIWDSISAYYWLGASHPELRKSGSVSLLLWKAIQFCSKKTNCFDFDGSMDEGIEQFFSSFGTIQIPCFSLSKSKNQFFDLLLILKKQLF
jgi:hypothetical protein